MKFSSTDKKSKVSSHAEVSNTQASNTEVSSNAETSSNNTSLQNAIEAQQRLFSPALAGLNMITKSIAYLPTSWLLWLGKQLGSIFYYVSPYRRHIAGVNIQICFPELNSKQRKQLIKQHFISIGQGMMEAMIAWWKPTRHLPPVQISGLEHLQQGLAQGRGVIMLSAHFTSLELVGRLCAQEFAFATVYRKQKNATVNKIMQTARSKIYAQTIDRTDTRSIYKALKNNQAVWLAVDQDYGRDHSTFAPFFGMATAFINSPTRLANKTKAVVIPVTFHRLPQNEGYSVCFAPAIENFAEQDADTNALMTSQFIENAIKLHPEQYLWIHRRFKTRPEGKAKFYQRTAALLS